MNIETERLKIRHIDLKDIESVFEYRSDEEVSKFQSWKPKTTDDVKQFIERNPSEFNIVGTWFQLVFIVKEGDVLVGDIGIHFIDDKRIEVGITLHKKYQNKGYATEALKGVFDSLFRDYKKQSIRTAVDPNNINSVRLMERLGMKKLDQVESEFDNGTWIHYSLFEMLNNHSSI